MSPRWTVAFGPLVRGVEGAEVPPSLERYVVAEEGRARRVTVRPDAPPPDGPGVLRGLGFVARDEGDHDAVWIRPARGEGQGIFAALGALVARDAPTVGAVVLHAGAVRVGRGVVLVVAPPGTGKTTLVRAAGARAFAGNAVLVTPDRGALPRARALPFAGDPDGALDAAGEERVRGIFTLERAEVTTAECRHPGGATTPWIMASVRPTGIDPHAADRVVLALAASAGVPSGIVRARRGDDATPVMDAALAHEGVNEMSERKVERSPAAVWRRVEGEVAIISMDVNRMRLLNEVGGFLWERCDGRTVDELVAELCAHYPVDRPTAERDVTAFIDDLSSRGLLAKGGGE